MGKGFLAVLAMAAAVAVLAKPTRSILGGEKPSGNNGNSQYDAEVEYIESTGSQWLDLSVNSTTGQRPNPEGLGL